MEVSNLFVCIMGMAVTFIGLTCLIFMTALMGKIVRSLGGTQVPAKAPAGPIPPAPAAEAIANRQELAAAISVALAEEMGTDVTGIRILSLKKIS